MKTMHREKPKLGEDNLSDDENAKAFHDILAALAAKDLYDEEETIKKLWIKSGEMGPI